MTDEIHDGGPVFPSEQGHTPDGTWNQTYSQGMTLRDYAAIHGIGLPDDCTHTYAGQFNSDAKPEQGDALAWAKWWAKAEWTARFINADAMLAARGQS